MDTTNKNKIHPREVANKSSKENLYKAINMALDIENNALRHNTQSFNTNRYKAVKNIDDYEELKERAREIKEYSIKILPELINKVTKAIENRGGVVYLAKTKVDATDYIKNVCKRHKSKLIVKSKSITSEEIELNNVLENEKIEVAETDLAEFILQVSKEQPSHIVAPAIHRSRERISQLFKENFDTDRPLETGEELTEFARDILRQKFLDADIGISGANMVSAEEGTILLVESEGNIRLTTQLPAVHIALVGVEKIIPSKKDFGTFIELLAASATGQPLTSYTNILEPPLNLPILNLNGRNDTKREFHLVLLDNGRMNMREDDDFREALYCIRCSACMNSCANFQAVGGHAFGGECYTGGIGGAWTVGTTDNIKNGRFAELCSGCTRCVTNCPVKIDIPHLNSVIKNRLIKIDSGPSLQKSFFGNFSTLAKYASITPVISNWINNLSFSRTVMEKAAGVDKRRKIPGFAKHTLEQQYRDYRKHHKLTQNKNKEIHELVLFADTFTNYISPHTGLATIRTFDKLGIPITLSRIFADGRASQSQGMLEVADKRAIETANYLANIIEQGKEIIVSEPSVLSMFRYDYKRMLGNDVLFKKLKEHTFDPIEYIYKLISNNLLETDKFFKKPVSEIKALFYHGHCQMKTIGAGNIVPELFTMLGYKVNVSEVECCGMAGSFGYKKEFYELSKNVGTDLINQIKNSESFDKDTTIVASGTSCREQISDELNNPIYHPIEFLELLFK